MGFFSFFVSTGVFSILVGALILAGVALLVASFFARKFRRESRTLARYGLAVLILGLIGFCYPMMIFLYLVLLIAWGTTQSVRK